MGISPNSEGFSGVTSSVTTNSIVTRLRLAGLRATGPRLAILAALESDSSHPSAEALLDNPRADHPALPRRPYPRRSRPAHGRGRAAASTAGG